MKIRTIKIKVNRSQLGQKIRYSGNWLEWQKMVCFEACREKAAKVSTLANNEI